MKKHFTTQGIMATWLAAASLFGCSTLAVKEIPITANPTTEIDKLEVEHKDALERQVNVLSPKYYQEGIAQLKMAQESRDKGKDTKVILDHVARGRANFEKANEIAKVSSSAIRNVVTARGQAIEAGAPKFLEKEFKAADGELTDATAEIEDNNLAAAEKIQDRLADRYSDLELKAIKIDKLAGAAGLIKQATEEGAEKNAPRTLAEAKKLHADADAYIDANRHDKEGIQTRANAATDFGNRLLGVSRQAKTTDKTDSEAIVLEREALTKSLTAEKALAQRTQSELAAEAKRKEAELTAAQATADALKTENRQLTSEKIDAEKLDAAKARFDATEADVYRDGNRLVIRLKKLAFPVGKANLTPSSFPVLGKVEKVIADLGPSKIVVEGHTDAVGSKEANQKLSEVRAAAISSYLVANGINAADISTVGSGDTKPLASNKTKEGRAQNRRVDIIVEPTSVAH